MVDFVFIFCWRFVMNVFIVYVYFELCFFNGVFKDFVVVCFEVVGYVV